MYTRSKKQTYSNWCWYKLPISWPVQCEDKKEKAKVRDKLMDKDTLGRKCLGNGVICMAPREVATDAATTTAEYQGG